MKKTVVLTILLACIGIQTFGQDQKFLVGGSLGTNFDKEETINNDLIDSKRTNLAISGLFGYFLTSRFVIGTELTYEKTKTNQNGVSSSETKSLDYVFSPFLRYYFNQAFIQAQGNFGKSDYNYNADLYIIDNNYNVDVENVYNILGWCVGIGYDFSLTNRLLLEPIIKYNSNKHTDKINDLDLKRNGLTLHVGFVFKL